MKILLLSTISSSLVLGVKAQCPPLKPCTRETFNVDDPTNYYQTTDGLSGDDLQNELNIIIRRNHKNYNYDCVWSALSEIDADPNNPDNIIAFYTQRSIPKLRRDCGNSDSDAWNREHVWSKSHGFKGRSQWAYTDIHHLVPADKSVNSDRGDRDFRVGGLPNKEEDCFGCKEGTGDTWEPPDELKGQVARMMFYMDVRYNGDDTSGTPDLELVDRTTSSNEPKFGVLSELLDWHCRFGVSEKERLRNNMVQSWQGNRNPFIDNPEFAESIWNYSCDQEEDGGGNTMSFSLSVRTDDFPEETSWKLVNKCTNSVQDQVTNHADKDKIYLTEKSIPSGEYTFTISDSFGDGMCCKYGSGSYVLKVDGNVVKEGGEYTTGESVNFGSCRGGEIEIGVTTDNYPEETSWALLDNSGSEQLKKNDFSEPNKLYTEKKDLPSGQYKFTIFDGYGDGICCTYGSGSYYVKVNGRVVKEGAQFSSNEVTSFSV